MSELNTQLIDFIDKNLSAEEHRKVEQAIAESSALKAEYLELKHMVTLMENAPQCTPSSKLKSNFDSLLAQEEEAIQSAKKGKSILFNPQFLMKYAAAAALLLVAGYFVGQNIGNKNTIETIAEEGQFTEAQMIAMLDEPSTSQRIKAVNIGYNMEDADDKIIDALIETMHTDESGNVRLAAANALKKFSSNDKVVDALIYTLEKSNDPMVTIEVINILASIKEKKALEPLEKIAKSNSHLNFVKDEAEVGIFKLKTI